MPCSRVPSEVAGRVVLADKVDPARERRRQSDVARTGDDMVISTMQRGGARLRAAGATVAHVRIVAAQGRLPRSVLPMDPVHAHGGITKS
jgi:hypothetical protein